jgi:CO/xanthine dehydrogenase FAD-binding subunit
VTEVASPRSLAEALRALERRPQLTPIAGCTDLMVGNDLTGLAANGVLDVTRIPELRGVRDEGDWVEIGAAATFSEVRRNRIVQQDVPGLAAAAAVIGGWQIQNRATIGGNIVNASPAGDSLPVLLALDAEIVAISSRGERRIPCTRFYSGYRQTTLEPGELVARVRIRRAVPGERHYFRKVGTRQAQAISKVVVALVGRLEGGKIADYRLSAGSVAPTTIRLLAVERAMVGEIGESSRADIAGRLAAESVEPIDDVRSTAAYRRHVLDRVVRRLTLQLFEDGPGV